MHSSYLQNDLLAREQNKAMLNQLPQTPASLREPSRNHAKSHLLTVFPNLSNALYSFSVSPPKGTVHLDAWDALHHLGERFILTECV